jgi:hypothetical protein
MKIIYEALNGERFESKALCVKYDKYLNEAAKWWGSDTIGAMEDCRVYADMRIDGISKAEAKKLAIEHYLGIMG